MPEEKKPDLPGKPEAPAVKEPPETARATEIVKPGEAGKLPKAAEGDAAAVTGTHSQDADRKRHARHVVSEK